MRNSYDRLVAYLARSSRDIAAAEDALADALASALRSWSDHGVPDRPETWLLTVARRNLIGAIRRRQTARAAMPTLAMIAEARAEPTSRDGGSFPDDRLELLYVCAHPAIDPGLHAALMLQVVLRLDAARIATSFLTSPATMGQRLSRAKAKIRDAGIPFEIPGDEQLPGRTRSVLDAIYAAYGTGWDDPQGTDPKRRGLTHEAARLSRLVVDLQPDDAEAHGLLALILHSDARQRARRDDAGRFVPLDAQDVTQWSREMMGEAEHHLDRAAALRRFGPYQLHAAIQSVHNRRALTGTTDWSAIAALYDGLVGLAPSIGALVARAAAHASATEAADGLGLLDELDPELTRSYQPYFATRAHILRLAGRSAEAAAAATQAVGLTTDPATRRHLIDTYDLGRSEPW